MIDLAIIRKALEPFASAARNYVSFDGQHDFLDSDPIAPDLTAGDLRHAREALAALSRLEAQQAEGWQLVPVEPTHEMLCKAIQTNPKLPYHDQHRKLWTAMLAAVPPPPTKGEGR